MEKANYRRSRGKVYFDLHVRNCVLDGGRSTVGYRGEEKEGRILNFCRNCWRLGQGKVDSRNEKRNVRGNGGLPGDFGCGGGIGGADCSLDEGKGQEDDIVLGREELGEGSWGGLGGFRGGTSEEGLNVGVILVSV